MEKTIYRYLPFECDELTTRKAKAYLEQQALLGYEFVSCKGLSGTLGWAKFKISEPKKIAYRLKIIDKRIDSANKSDEQEVGWELVGQIGSVRIFRWNKEEEVPDWFDLEAETKKALAVNTVNQFAFIVWIPLILLISNNLFEWHYENLFSNLQLFQFVTIPLLVGIALQEILKTSFYKRRINEEIKAEAITVKGMRKAVMLRRILIITFIVLFTFSIITELFSGNGVIVIGILAVIWGIGGFFGYRLNKATELQDKNIRRKRMISSSLIGIIATIGIPIMMFPLMAGHIGSTERIRTDMSKYPILSIGTLEKLDKEDYRTQMFHKSTSILVPRGYEYSEYLKDGRMVKTDYYQTTHPKIAKIIYNGKIEEYVEAIKKREDDISSRLKSIEGNSYTSREIIYDQEENILFIREGKKVLILEGDIDFEEKKYKETIEKIL